MRKTLPALLALAVSALANPALALDPLPKKEGFSGFVGVGATGGQVKSNFLAELMTVELSNRTIYNLGSPYGTNIVLPVFDYNLGYTFDNKKTRVSVRTTTEDMIDFSSNNVLALRHNFDAAGNVEVAALLPGAVRVEVWENPYMTNQGRGKSEWYTTGARIAWDKIMGSNFEVIGAVRKVDVDTERSGQNMGLTSAQQKLLEREGDLTRIELGYKVPLGGGEHVIRPAIAYVDRDLDGKAMAQEGYELDFSYSYSEGDFQWLSRGSYQKLDGDKVNPIFGKKNDTDVYGLSTQLRFLNPFGWDKWTAVAAASYGKDDADITFNEGSVLMGSLRVIRNF